MPRRKGEEVCWFVLISNIKIWAKKIIYKLVFQLSKTRVGMEVERLVIESAMMRTTSVRHAGVNINFCIPNALTRWRADTFSEKEPETLNWIDEQKPGSVFWDVGANVGLYSIYAVKSRRAKVYAFEPSIFNLEVLGRNIVKNQCAEDIFIIPLAINNQNSFALMRHTTTEWGGALSSFDAKFGHDGKNLKSIFSYNTVVLYSDFMVSQKLVPPPQYLKIDVDGLEHIILSNSKKMLSSVQSILIEVNENFSEQKTMVEKILKEAGFSNIVREKSPFAGEGAHGDVFNQIWQK